MIMTEEAVRTQANRLYTPPNSFSYGLWKAACKLLSALVFRRVVLRNELKGAKGPALILGNHECALDFVDLIDLTDRRISFVISRAYHDSFPLQRLLNGCGMIAKQQFQTEISDLKRMKSVIDAGELLAIYPAGLMTGDGAATPVPGSVTKFVRWMNTDVYAARISGSYFVFPKWSGKFHPGRTYMDVYRLIEASELKTLSDAELMRRLDEVLKFDEYEEQEKRRIKYLGGSDIRGLENILYACPGCGTEFSMETLGKDTIRCHKCGFTAKSDKYGLLHANGKTLHPSEWSRSILNEQLRRIRSGEEVSLSVGAEIEMIDEKAHKFVPVGRAVVTLGQNGFVLDGELRGEKAFMEVPIRTMPTVPYKPGKNFDLQNEQLIYRCVPDERRLVMKYVNMVKSFYRLREE